MQERSVQELLQILPWAQGSTVAPSEGTKFEPFKVSHLIYPDEETLRSILLQIEWRRGRARLPSQELLEDLGEEPQTPQSLQAPDLIRVVADERGHIHWRLGHWIKNEDQKDDQLVKGPRLVKELRHHGGRFGVSSLDGPINQADRIIDRILGFKQDEQTKKRLEEIASLPEDESEETIITPLLTFSAARIGLQAAIPQFEIGGEQALIRQYLALVEDVLRGQIIPSTTPRLQVMLQRLERLDQTLRKREAPQFVLARENLEKFLTERDRPSSIGDLINLEGNFSDRLKELGQITKGIARRQVAMRLFRDGQEDYIGLLYLKIFDLLKGWETRGWSEEEIVGNVRGLIHSPEAYSLSRLLIQPYKDHANQVGRLLDLEGALTAGDLERVGINLNQAISELHASERYTNRRRYGQPRQISG